MKIIGIAGTNGSGKDTVSKILADDHGWLFVSASGDLIIPELKKRGLPASRENMAALSAEWRKELGMGAVVDKALEKFKATGRDEGLVISSLRHPGEADRVHEFGGRVVWVDADPRIRYERITSRGQGIKDKKSFDEFLAEEKAEMEQSGDETTLYTAAVKERADIFIENNGSDIEAFKTQIKQSLSI